MKSIKYPQLRVNLVSFLQSLSDIEYQKEVWVEGRQREKIQHDEFDYSVHFFFDDTTLAVDANDNVGYILYDEHEAFLIGRLTQSIDNVLNKYGTNLSDEEYISVPEWSSVIDCAKAALKAVMQNDAASSKA